MMMSAVFLFTVQHGGRSIPHDYGMTLNWLKMTLPDYVKKLMVFQTTGETVLHRAARLGYEVSHVSAVMSIGSRLVR